VKFVRLSLFWRTFLLLAFSTLLSVTVTLQMIRWLDKTPPEQQIAWELASVVNLTRNALVSSSGERRQSFLGRLAKEERAGLSPLEPSDILEPMTSDAGGLKYELLDQRIKQLLGPNTKIAQKVNGSPGLWISFEIESDAYWLTLDSERLRRHDTPPLFTIALIALGLSLISTISLGRLINQPLKSLSIAINKLGAGQSPPKLNETGPTEIAQLNRRFNDMARDLSALEEDRRIALAGISHDIRSPLARLRMEIELSQLSAESINSMAQEIEQVDRIVGQFVDFARNSDLTQAEPIDIQEHVSVCLARYQNEIDSGDVKLSLALEPGLQWKGRAVDLHRLLANLIDNAMRYGRSVDGICRLHITAKSHQIVQGNAKRLRLIVKDEGKGVQTSDLNRLTRPFARVDQERTSAGGSGLGLAIVERTARRYDGRCTLSLNQPNGLIIDLTL
jgi:two-component system, OmpR family, osmolarity sensor histidine kinase EnvZ